MERLAIMIDNMIDMKILNQTNKIVSFLDMDISALFSNLKYDIQPFDNLEFQSDLNSIFFKYMDRFVTISYKRKFMNYGFKYKYKYKVIVS